jgi:hypothetical protein
MILGRSTAVSLVVCLSCLPASADSYVKVAQPAGKDGSGTGCSSATLIGWTTDCSNGIFISCAHGYDPERPVEIQIDRDQDQPVEGRIIVIDRNLELSLIAAPISRSTEMLRLADRSPRTCDAVRLIGFPDRKFTNTETCITGRFWSRDACTSRWTLYQAEPCCGCPAGYQELHVTAAASAPGLSGGAVVRNRKLAGVVIGRIENAHDAGLVVPGETVRLFVRRNITLFYRR